MDTNETGVMKLVARVQKCSFQDYRSAGMMAGVGKKSRQAANAWK